jgi:hypothetical protein
MRKLAVTVLSALAVVPTLQAQAPQPQTLQPSTNREQAVSVPNAARPTTPLPVGPRLIGSTRDLMMKVFYPLGDQVFYVRGRLHRTKKNGMPTKVEC